MFDKMKAADQVIGSFRYNLGQLSAGNMSNNKPPPAAITFENEPVQVGISEIAGTL